MEYDLSAFTQSMVVEDNYTSALHKKIHIIHSTVLKLVTPTTLHFT